MLSMNISQFIECSWNCSAFLALAAPGSILSCCSCHQQAHVLEFAVRLSQPLQVRRSTYHDVVKAADLEGLGVSLQGVQGYSINNARVRESQCLGNRHMRSTTSPASMDRLHLAYQHDAGFTGSIVSTQNLPTPHW
jgi:hypothetical protein